ncbi:hypothetical protein CAEBREN_23134 [Caenorhabditis brenneri]|uniref:Uncharacterized protein n=1 Tax=Caenorhabditis brenneri TaxID=135651 RepID=G0N7X2_CAEBE|nr:hypothetical protein CAEBREN_23134 [Caenorhabditis brenneri]
MSIHSIADVLEAARTVLESDFPSAMLLTDARTVRIKQLERTVEEIEAKNAHLQRFLAHKTSQMTNMKDLYTREILRLQNNVNDVVARLDGKTKHFEEAIVENIKLGIEVGKQAAIISESQRKTDTAGPSAAKSQQSDVCTKGNVKPEISQPMIPQNFWNDFHKANPPPVVKTTAPPPTDMKNVDKIYTANIFQILNNITEGTARLDSKPEGTARLDSKPEGTARLDSKSEGTASLDSKPVQKVAKENDKLGNKVAKQAAIISETNAQRKMENLVAAQSQQADYSKKSNDSPQISQPVIPQSFWNNFHKANPPPVVKTDPTPPIQWKDLKKIYTANMFELPESTARLDSKPEVVQKVVEENGRLGNNVAEEDDVIFLYESQRETDNLVPSAAQSEKSDLLKKADASPQISQPLAPQTSFNDFSETKSPGAKMGSGLNPLQQILSAVQSQQPDFLKKASFAPQARLHDTCKINYFIFQMAQQLNSTAPIQVPDQSQLADYLKKLNLPAQASFDNVWKIDCCSFQMAQQFTPTPQTQMAQQLTPTAPIQVAAQSQLADCLKTLNFPTQMAQQLTPTPPILAAAQSQLVDYLKKLKLPPQMAQQFTPTPPIQVPDQSQLTDYLKKASFPPQMAQQFPPTPQTQFAAQSMLADLLKKLNLPTQMAQQLTSTPSIQVAAQSQLADCSMKANFPPQMTQQLTPTPPTQVATRKRGRPRKNVDPLNIVLPPALKRICRLPPADESPVEDPNAPIWHYQKPGTSGSDSSGRHDSPDIN